MGDPSILVENLGKRYRIAHQRSEGSYQRLSERMAAWVKAPFSRFRPPATMEDAPQEEDFWALRDVSFEVQPGQTLGVIGRNGAGKSTLLKLLSRITVPTTGRITLNGRVASLLEVGTGFHPELTGRENIYLNGAILGMSRAEIRSSFDEIVDFAGVEKFLDTPVKRYSSGMHLRLAFAVAAHLRPEILIVDEVLAVGDAQFQNKCLGKMEDVIKTGRTIIFVSHNMAAVKALCENCIVLDQGRLRHQSATSEAIALYTEGLASGSGQSWTRNQTKPVSSACFDSVTCTKVSDNPRPKFRFELGIVIHQAISTSFVALDICDAAHVPLMQAMPEAHPFIPGEPGQHRLSIEVELPPLIPGLYHVDCWIGLHYSSTLDYVRRAVTFEIDHSPCAERSFPYTPDHGHVIPPCTYHYQGPL